MDHEFLDTLARSVGTTGGTRRVLLRFLTGTALVAVVARLGLNESVDAKPKRSKHRQAASSRHGRPPRAVQPAGGLETEGKRKNKGKSNGPGKNKHHPKPPNGPLPPGPPCPTGQRQCADGACVPVDQCCWDQIRCSNGSCVNLFDCCPDEQRCSAELCIPNDRCCPGQKRCDNGDCIAPDECCADAVPPLCEECAYAGCQNGNWVCEHPDPCPSNKDRDPHSCKCVCSVEGYIDCIGDNCDCHVAEGDICFNEGPICCIAGSAYCATADSGKPGCCREGYDACLANGCCPTECLCPEDTSRCCTNPCRNG